MAKREKPSRQVLDEAPARAFEFLIGVGKNETARAALFAKGFTQAEHEYAWSRLRRLGEFVKPGSGLDKEVAAAIAEVDAWDEPNFDAIESTLVRDFEAQADFLFDNLDPQQGNGAVLGVDTFLDRIAALKDGPQRTATRDADHAALALLATRGYTADEWSRLRGLVNKAKTLVKVEPISQDEREKVLNELYRWHKEWSSHSRNGIKGRAALITLGLAKRQKRKNKEPEPGEDIKPKGNEGAKPAEK